MQVQNLTQRAPRRAVKTSVRDRRDHPLNDSSSSAGFMAGGALSFLEPSPFTRQKGCVVEPFTDNVLVTPNNLLYADQNYFLKDIASFQVVKLSCRKSAIHKKFVNLLGTIAITIGLILLYAAPAPLSLIGSGMAGLSILYLSLFYWRLLHQKVGEYGLLVHLHPGHRRVITSHSLRAIQNLFQALLQCLERPEETDNFVSVNMYTGDIYTQ
ncbi:MAG: hypothetical protein AAFV46_02605 [Cyanobacteria bacterium J06635_11]